ncbi:uncharacterized protein LOC125009736 [Mugil cephalus]|uniref:uncharacterized protein LOC125009736 n=1 Tax=Mugil cephalus TaxID=48193 RepID=UPI001FB630D2|nr:uncharacterized protein LOC125009736 [Mugil cephalus]XP_047443866.1 uncharacterized protein LOC125009736 [Mugil cephalus]
MNIILISSLLDVAALVLQVAALEEPRDPVVSARTPGSNIYLGECVWLRCVVESNSTFKYSYQWHREKLHSAASPNPTGVTREDAGNYRCRAEPKESNTSVVLNGKMTSLIVSELTPPSLTLTRSHTQTFKDKHFVQCPVSKPNSTGSKLKHFSPSHSNRTTVSRTDVCPPLEGVVTANKSCVFTAASVNGGLYWCEGAKGCTRTVNVTVSGEKVILKIPAYPVTAGNTVVLHCLNQTGNHSKISFFKDGELVTLNSSTSDGLSMTIENVTKEDEGFYKCASSDGKIESPESWLSVRGSLRSTDASSNGSWKWIIVPCVVLLFLIPLTVWLVHRYRHKMFHTKSWELSKEDIPAVALPVTKQDVTEVQWDLSWMEMSNLLDK